jgi:hypothetical protein
MPDKMELAPIYQKLMHSLKIQSNKLRIQKIFSLKKMGNKI